MHNFTKELFKFSDKNYKEFSCKLIPDTNREIIGVRAPKLKSFAKSLDINSKETIDFLSLTHTYHEEFLLHGLLLSYIKDIDLLLNKLKDFMPFIDNWAVCDSTTMTLKLLKKHPEKALNFTKECLNSSLPYTVRFGIVCLLSYFLDDNFNSEILSLALSVKSDNYYVNMGLAWFYSVALVKQYQQTIPILEQRILPKFVHNKSIQKAVESFRITAQTKNYLKTLKIKDSI